MKCPQPVYFQVPIDSLLKQLPKALVKRALEGEMTDHLGYPKHSPIGKNTRNSRNGRTTKTIRGKNGKMEIAVPRDRDGEFEPQLTRLKQFADQKPVSY